MEHMDRQTFRVFQAVKALEERDERRGVPFSSCPFCKAVLT
jgi:hypothetical protein